MELIPIAFLLILVIYGIIVFPKQTIDKSKIDNTPYPSDDKPINYTSEISPEDKLRGFKLSETSRLNNRGIVYEKEGDTISAIDTYEACIHYKYPAYHAYDRLLVLYRKKKMYEDELRVARTAIEVFMQENDRRAKGAIKHHPELEEEIKLSLETNKPLIDDEGICYFNPYNVFKYIERLEKIKVKIKRQKNYLH